jgi:hypothetical protein
MVKVKIKFTRFSLHDMFWFELPQTVEEEEAAYEIYGERSVDSYDENIDSVINKEELRPDIADMIKLDELSSAQNFNPSIGSSLVTNVTFIFNSLEEFKQANQDLFNSVGEIMLTKAKQTNNTFEEKVYDENDVFIENGLFNQE